MASKVSNPPAPRSSVKAKLRPRQKAAAAAPLKLEPAAQSNRRPPDSEIEARLRHTKKRLKQAKVLLSISRKVAAIESLDEILNLVVEMTTFEIGAERGRRAIPVPRIPVPTIRQHQSRLNSVQVAAAGPGYACELRVIEVHSACLPCPVGLPASHRAQPVVKRRTFSAGTATFSRCGDIRSSRRSPVP